MQTNQQTPGGRILRPDFGPVVADTALLRRTPPAQRLPKVLPVGTRVLVNCFHADIVEVALSVVQYNVADPNECWVNPLRSPLYTVEIDFDAQYDWHSRQVYIPVGVRRLKLFADEFRVVALPVRMGRPARALPPDALFEGAVNESIRYYRLAS